MKHGLIAVVLLILCGCGTTPMGQTSEPGERVFATSSEDYGLSISRLDMAGQSINVVWDTGTTANVIDRELLVSSGIPEAQTKTQTFNIKDKTGRRIAKNAIAMDLSSLRWINVRLIVGFPEFQGRTVIFDQPQKTVHLVDGAVDPRFIPVDPVTFPLTVLNGQIFFDIQVNGQHVRALLDTGSTSVLDVYDKAILDDRSRFEKFVGIGDFTAFGQYEGGLVSVHDVEVLGEKVGNFWAEDGIGKQTATNPNAEQDRPAVAIGSGFFKGGTLVLDLVQKIGFWKRSAPMTVMENPVPFLADFYSETHVIKSVRKGGSELVFKVGDILLEIDGRKVSSKDAYLAMMNLPEKHIITVSRDGRRTALEWQEAGTSSLR